MLLQVQEVNDVFDLATKRDFLAAHLRQEEDVAGEARSPVHMTTDQQVVEDGFTVEEFRVLEGARNAQFGDVMCRDAGHVLAPKGHATGVGVVEPADQVEHRRLARPVGADDAKHFAIDDLERYVAHGLDAAEADRKLLSLEQAVFRHQCTRSVRR